MCNFRKAKRGRNPNSAPPGYAVMAFLAVTFFLLLNVILPPNVEAGTRGSSGFGIFLTLLNPALVRYDTFFHPEAPAPFALFPGRSSYVADLAVSARMPPSAIILPDGVRIAAEKIRPRTPPRVVISGRIFDHRVEVPPKMEKVYLLRIDDPPTDSSGISEAIIVVLYQ